jgi:hypothetical protein
VSLPTLHGTGKLLTDPKQGTSHDGSPWCSVILKFQTWRKGDDGWVEGDGAVASLIAFKETAAKLARFAKGDEVEFKGTASVGIWKDQPQFKVTVTACRVPVKAPTQRQKVAA